MGLSEPLSRKGLQTPRRAIVFILSPKGKGRINSDISDFLLAVPGPIPSILAVAPKHSPWGRWASISRHYYGKTNTDSLFHAVDSRRPRCRTPCAVARGQLRECSVQILTGGGALPEWTFNMLRKHSVRSCLEYAKSFDLKRARSLSNPDLAPHLEFVDLGGHG